MLCSELYENNIQKRLNWLSDFSSKIFLKRTIPTNEKASGKKASKELSTTNSSYRKTHRMQSGRPRISGQTEQPRKGCNSAGYWVLVRQKSLTAIATLLAPDFRLNPERAWYSYRDLLQLAVEYHASHTAAYVADHVADQIRCVKNGAIAPSWSLHTFRVPAAEILCCRSNCVHEPGSWACIE